MIYVLALDSENKIHEVQVETWKAVVINIEFWEKTLTIKQVYLTEHKYNRDNKKLEWAKWLSD